MKGQKDITAEFKGRILIMDDDTEHTAHEAEVLVGAGYGVELARDGIEALEIYKRAWDSEKPFDVVMLALSVARGMGAIGTFKELIKLDHKIKAIISSGHLNENIIDNFTRYGFQGILFKPCSNQRLLRVVREAMEKGASC